MTHKTKVIFFLQMHSLEENEIFMNSINNEKSISQLANAKSKDLK